MMNAFNMTDLQILVVMLIECVKFLTPDPIWDKHIKTITVKALKEPTDLASC